MFFFPKVSLICLRTLGVFFKIHLAVTSLGLLGEHVCFFKYIFLALGYLGVQKKE